jgi:signal transduction histidine kinase
MNSMTRLHPFSNSKVVRLDADTILKAVLHFILVASYVVLAFTLVVAVVVLPFDDPSVSFVPPAWFGPVAGIPDLLAGFLAIIFGPALGISFVALLVVIITTPRVSRWLRVGINDLIYGQHDDAFALISQVNPHISAMNLPHTILPTIAATIAQTLKLPYVELEAQSGDTPIINTVGTLPSGATIERLPLLYHDIKIGELRVAARRSDESLSQSDLTVLQDLARQVGIALYAAQLTDDLQRARIRLVTAREEERRRIRRDLHDGLGPSLANFAMQLEQARENLPAEAVESSTILAHLTLQAQNTITDVRRLVYDLRPPDLDEFGLLSALREYIHRRQTKYTRVRLVEPSALPTLPAAVEVAAYRIVQEALNNALKHAHASEVTIALAIEPTIEPAAIEPSVERQPQHARRLRVEIADNGTGIPVDHTAGIGLHSMRERAEELGGSCTIASSQEGTHVVAYLPLEYPN